MAFSPETLARVRARFKPPTVRWARLTPRLACFRREDRSPGLYSIRWQDAGRRPELCTVQLCKVPVRCCSYTQAPLLLPHDGLTVAPHHTGNALRYYFTVNARYVRNKLKVVLCPFTLKGHWNRSLEQARRQRITECASVARRLNTHALCSATGCRRHQVQAAVAGRQRARLVHTAHGFPFVLPAVLHGRRGVRAQPLQAGGAPRRVVCLRGCPLS